MINFLKPHTETIVLVFVFYILPLILNVALFRSGELDELPPEAAAFITICPLVNWMLPIGLFIGWALQTIGGWVLP